MSSFHKNKMRIKLTFGKPDHGWLPLLFLCDNFKLENEISDVPIDPMEQLCDALLKIISGEEKPELVPWHLGPYCYYLELEKIENIYKLTIYKSDDLVVFEKRELTKEITGNFEEIILPLYQSVKGFYAQDFDFPHWLKINLKKIERLKKLVKNRL